MLLAETLTAAMFLHGPPVSSSCGIDERNVEIGSLIITTEMMQIVVSFDACSCKPFHSNQQKRFYCSEVNIWILS